MDTVEQQPMDGWHTLPWKKFEKNVWQLQKRIYRASRRGDVKTVRKLQRLLTKSRSAKLLAVRRVTQDNQGKKTAGVDGVKSLTPPQRLAMADTLKIEKKAKPVRRVWIPKTNSDELRPLGIPTMRCRALQTLVKAALEPEWESRFEPNSYGFRPGRSAHDAIEAIFTAISHKPKYVLDADIAKCFDKIGHAELLRKINTSPSFRRQIKAWLKAGVMDNDELFPTEEGTMQGGTISPLLACIALHGLETFIVEKFPRSNRRGFAPPNVVVYADDFVILHKDLEVVRQCQELAAEYLKRMGLELKPSKTRITHTLSMPNEQAGFDFLNFNVRQYPVGKTKSGKDCRGRLHGFKTLIRPSTAAVKRHLEKLRATVDKHQHSNQERLIKTLNPVIRGWTNYYKTVASSRVFAKIRYGFFPKLFAWANYRHPNKGKHWVADKYWSFTTGKRWIFKTPNSNLQLYQHDETPIRRHVKVQGSRSPYDGDWVYWSTRLGRDPEIPLRVTKLLKEQKGRCPECGLYFKDGDAMEVDHIIAKQWGGRDAHYNRQLLHRHCHMRKTAREKEMMAA